MAEHTFSTIQWTKLAAMSVVIGGLYAFATWGIGQLNGHAEKMAKNDSALSRATRADAYITQNHWRIEHSMIDRSTIDRSTGKNDTLNNHEHGLHKTSR